MSSEYECCASGSCEVCRRPSGYSRETRDRLEQERDNYDPPWVVRHEREGWAR